MKTFKMLDACSGIGGFTLAYESTGGFRTIGFCEIDPYAIEVLKYHWPHIPQLGDLRLLSRGRSRKLARRIFEAIGPVDVLTAGIPCQPTSSLGRMRGTSDERWLWPDAIRLVRLLRPKIVHFENPTALLALERGRAFGGITTEMAALGYDLWWDVVPAAAFGAGHLRERLYLIGTDARYRSLSEKREWQYHEMGREQFHWGLRQEPDRSDAESQRRQAWLHGSAGTGKGDDGSSPGKFAATDAQGECQRDAHLQDHSRPGRKRAWRVPAEFCHEPIVAHANGERWEQTRRELLAGESRTDYLRRFFTAGYRPGAASDSDRPGLQGHERNGSQQSEETGAYTPIGTPDLRGRVNQTGWWMEAVTGIPVLAHGLSSRMAEAFARTTGNAIVPQAIVPYAEAVYKTLVEMTEAE